MEPSEKISDNAQIAVIVAEIGHIKESMKEIKSLLVKQGEQFVTKEQFAPVRMIVYGMVALVMTSFITGLIILVWKT